MAYGINDNGQVAGSSYIENLGPHAFLYSEGVMQDLGTLGGAVSYAFGINNNGQVTGYSSANGYHAFLYSDGVMTDLNTFAPFGWTLKQA